MTESARAGLRFGGALTLALWAIGATDAYADAALEPGVRGHVETATSRWTSAGDAIVTDIVIRTADGHEVVVTTPGGSVGGLGMTFSHHDSNLRPDDELVLVTDRQGVRVQRIASARLAPTTPHAAGGSRVGVQRTSISGRALFHPNGCISFVYDGDGTDQLANEWDAVDTAFTAWEGASQELSCGGVTFARSVMPHAPDGRDGINTIHFRDDTWCRPATLTEPAVCHSPQAVAVTRTLFVDDPLSPRDGEILEVDIEVNAVDFALATDGRAGSIDLSSAMAHEIGHALGLDHNCGVENGAWPTDVNGAMVASCESASPELGVATMYFQVAPGTTTMRTPEATDVADLCAVVNGLCAPDVTSSGCAVGADPSAAPLLLLLPLLRRRRQRR